MHAIDVMTSEVISVDENATVPVVAKLLAERGISAVPVVDKNNRVIGMVSEGDLLPANVIVKEGVVHLWSSYLSEQEKRALVVAAGNIPGVRRIEDHMRRVGTTLLG